MAEKIKEPRKVTLSNTKQEMITAYNELFKQLQEKESMELKPEIVMEQKRTKEIVKASDDLSVEGVTKSISQLRLDISGMLGKIAEEMEAEVGKYRKVKEAVEIKGNELEEIYGIHKAAQSLAVLIEAQTQKRFTFENEMEEQKNNFEHEMNVLTLEREEDKKRYETVLKEQQIENNRLRQRDKEEYEYTFKREKQSALDKLNDEQAKKEKELKVKWDTFEKQLTERENLIKRSEDELNLLRKKVEGFPKEIESAAQKAVKDTTEKNQADARNREEFSKKSFEGERNVLQTKIESLESLVKEQKESIIKLSQQLEKAYQTVEDIAGKAAGTGSDFMKAHLTPPPWATSEPLKR